MADTRACVGEVDVAKLMAARSIVTATFNRFTPAGQARGAQLLASARLKNHPRIRYFHTFEAVDVPKTPLALRAIRGQRITSREANVDEARKAALANRMGRANRSLWNTVAKLKTYQFPADAASHT